VDVGDGDGAGLGKGLGAGVGGRVGIEVQLNLISSVSGQFLGTPVSGFVALAVTLTQ